ncbi:hypothetical protein L208DRAFT_1351219, partial [Tricholoma matsutake]
MGTSKIPPSYRPVFGHGGKLCPSNPSDDSHQDEGEDERPFGLPDLPSELLDDDDDDLKFGSNILVIVHSNGVHHLPIQWCRCPGHIPDDIQALDLQFFPASFKQVKTLFTFEGLDSFLAKKQECKSSAWHYYQKLRRFTSTCFPKTIPVSSIPPIEILIILTLILMQFQNLKHLKWHGFGHNVESPGLGDLAVLCPTCPQVGINLPEDWKNDKEQWVYTWSFAIDGNFTASHQCQKQPEDDVPLTNGQSFMTESSAYKAHLKIVREFKQPPCTCNEFKADWNVNVAGYDATGIGSVVCLRHRFFQPEATVDFQKGEQQKNIDYAICKALNSKTMKGINRSLLVYDIFGQWIINFLLQVNQSPFLSIPEGLKITGAIGDFHVVGHIDDCLPRYTLAYVPGSGVIDGEIVETLWAVLNETSQSAKGATMAH